MQIFPLRRADQWRSAHTGFRMFLMLAAFTLSPFASAAEPVPGMQRDREAMQARMSAIIADPQRLEAATKAGAERGKICAYCHGDNGISTKPWLPNLAGQSAEYILDQNLAYATGERKSNVMNDLAASLSDEELIELSVFFAVQSPENIQADTEGRDLLVGRNFYKSTCMRCHGEDGRGQEGYTWIAGQKQEYVRRALTRYRDRDSGRLNEKMVEVTDNISNQLIEDVAAYVATLH